MSRVRYLGHMAVAWRPWMTLLTVFALAIAAFVVAPSADAASCAPEPPAAHALVDHNPADGDHEGRDGKHGVCVHGHCHHSLALRPEASPASVWFAPVAERLVRIDLLRASSAPDGLKRPPRT